MRAVNSGVAAITTPTSLTTHTLPPPLQGTYWGLASVNALNLQPREIAGHVQAGRERLDAVVKEEVLLLKADVEGWEAQVGAGVVLMW